jgi:hypothetical protein
MMSSKSEALNESRLVVLIRTLSIKINKELPFQHHELETQKLRGNYNTSATIIESKIYQRCTQSACHKRLKRSNAQLDDQSIATYVNTNSCSRYEPFYERRATKGALRNLAGMA